MKKQVFGLIAALFVCAVLLPVGVHATDADAAGVYAILYEDGTLVFQNGNTPEPGRAVAETYPVDLTAVYTFNNNTGNVDTPWYDEYKSIRIVNFLDKISPIATACWFYRCYNLERVDNIHNLDTVRVADMSYMFWSCGLTALDVSNFNTANVTNMNNMFYGCSGLTALDVSHFNTANVTDMSSMFDGCRGLTALDVSNFNTANVTNMAMMFRDCRNLTALDVSHFDTTNVTDMVGMFSICSNLEIIYASHKFTTALVDLDEGIRGSYIFDDCTSLVGGNGTVFDENHTSSEYARIDTPDAPGYFTDKSTVYAITAAVPRNRTLSVTLSNPAAATVAVACFDMNGRFLSVNLQDAPANVGAVTVSVPANAKRALVMLWNNARRPLCAAFPADV